MVVGAGVSVVIEEVHRTDGLDVRWRRGRAVTGEWVVALVAVNVVGARLTVALRLVVAF